MKEELKAIFEFVFGKDANGYIRMFSKSIRAGSYEETFFEYPNKLDDVIAYASRNKYDRDTYFCPHLFTRPEAK